MAQGVALLPAPQAVLSTGHMAGEVLALEGEAAAVAQLTNLSDINRLLQETLGRERAVDEELEGLLTKRSEIEGRLATLQSSTTEASLSGDWSQALELVTADAEGLAGSVKNTCDLSERVSIKVRELDSAQSHVRETLAAIEVIMNRTKCIYGVRDAMVREDFEAAAGFVGAYMEIEESSAASVAPDGPQATEQAQILVSAKAQLGQVLRQRLDVAVAAGEAQDVLRFTKLFKPLRMQEEGLKVFTQYLRQLAAAHAQEGYTILVEGGSGGAGQDDYVGAMTALFRDIAVTVEEQEPFLGAHFSPGSVLELVMGLQAECDAGGSRILQRYVSFRQFARITKSITQRSGVGDSADGLALDPREVEGYLEELLLLCQRSEEYNQFMLAKMQDAVAPNTLGVSRENAFRGGRFNTALGELVSYYVAIEQYYMEHNVGKAIDIRQPSVGSVTTSMVDDAFFVLQKCGRRALATSNAACVCAVLGQLNNLLSSAIYPELKGKLEAGLLTRVIREPQNVASKLLVAEAAAAAAEDGGSTGAAPGAAASAAGRAAKEAAYINDAEVSSGYVLKLRAELEEVAAAIWGAAGSEREQIRSVLADLAKTSGDFKQLAAWALASITSALMSRIRLPLDEVAAVSYCLTEAQYAANEAGDTWVQALVAALGAALAGLQPLLTRNNYDVLVSLLLEDVASRVDAILASKRFNQLGGLQLDRHMRALVAAAADLTQRPVRDKFAELSQKATVLSLEAVEEMLEYWGDNAGPMNWRLSGDDIRAVLRQRDDFAADEIAGLLL